MNELHFLHVIFQALIPNGTSDMGRMTFTSFTAYRCCCLVAESYLSLSSPTLSSPHELSGSPFPSPGDRPDPGIKPASPVAPALVGGLFTTEPPGKPHVAYAVFL